MGKPTYTKVNDKVKHLLESGDENWYTEKLEIVMLIAKNRWAWQITAGRDIDDIVQILLMRLWQTWQERGEEIDNYSAYFYKIIHNTFIETYQRQVRTNVLPLAEDEEAKNARRTTIPAPTRGK